MAEDIDICSGCSNPFYLADMVLRDGLYYCSTCAQNDSWNSVGVTEQIGKPRGRPQGHDDYPSDDDDLSGDLFDQERMVKDTAAPSFDDIDEPLPPKRFGSRVSLVDPSIPTGFDEDGEASADDGPVWQDRDYRETGSHAGGDSSFEGSSYEPSSGSHGPSEVDRFFESGESSEDQQGKSGYRSAGRGSGVGLRGEEFETGDVLGPSGSGYAAEGRAYASEPSTGQPLDDMEDSFEEPVFERGGTQEPRVAGDETERVGADGYGRGSGSEHGDEHWDGEGFESEVNPDSAAWSALPGAPAVEDSWDRSGPSPAAESGWHGKSGSTVDESWGSQSGGASKAAAPSARKLETGSFTDLKRGYEKQAVPRSPLLSSILIFLVIAAVFGGAWGFAESFAPSYDRLDLQSWDRDKDRTIADSGQELFAVWERTEKLPFSNDKVRIEVQIRNVGNQTVNVDPNRFTIELVGGQTVKPMRLADKTLSNLKSLTIDRFRFGDIAPHTSQEGWIFVQTNGIAVSGVSVDNKAIRRQ